MMKKHWEIIRKIRLLIWRLISYEIWKLIDTKDKLIQKIEKPPMNIKDLNELRKTISEIPNECATLNEDVKKVWGMYDEIDNFQLTWISKYDQIFEEDIDSKITTEINEQPEIQELFKKRQDVAKFWKMI